MNNFWTTIYVNPKLQNLSHVMVLNYSLTYLMTCISFICN